MYRETIDAPNEASPPTVPHNPHYRRPVASAGGLYPLEIYVVAEKEDAFRLYHYAPRRHALEDLDVVLDDSDIPALGPPSVALATAPVIVIIMGLFGRSQFKYGPRGYRFTLLEAGALTHQLQLSAQALGLQSRPHTLFDDSVERMCRVDGVGEAFLNAVLVGFGNQSATEE